MFSQKLVQAMLCKTSDGIIDITLYQDSQSNTIWLNNWDTTRDAVEYTASGDSNINYVVDLVISWTSYQNGTSEIYKNDTLLTSQDETGFGYRKITWNTNISSGDKIKIKHTHNGNNNAYLIQGTTLTIKNSIGKTINWNKPRELETIGNKARTTIFWIHIDGTRITHE